MQNSINSNPAATPSPGNASLLKQGALILDVRSPEEFNTGHIKGSINIPLNEIQNRIAELRQTNKPLITCCQSGGRSGMAKTLLSAAGLICVNGGAWNELNTKI